MNHDENNPDLQAWIEPEVEARLVAWVLGEASAFEAAELERLTGEKPELAIFKRRIEAVHGLVGLATRPEQAPMRLAPERRAKILQTIDAPETRPPTAEPELTVIPALAATRRKQHRAWQWRVGIAACLALGAILAVTTIPSFQRVRSIALGPDEKSKRAAMDQKVMELPQLEMREPDKMDSTVASQGVVDNDVRTAQDMRMAANAAKAAEDRRAAQQPLPFGLEPPAYIGSSVNRKDGYVNLDLAQQSLAYVHADTLAAPKATFKELPRPAASELPTNLAVAEMPTVGGMVAGSAKIQRPEPMATAMGQGGITVGGRVMDAPAGASTYSSGGQLRVTGGATVDGASTIATTAGSGAAIMGGLVAGAGVNFGFGSSSASLIAGTENKKAENTVKLDAFEVSSPSSRGYYAAGSVAGGRISSKLSDLAGAGSPATTPPPAGVAWGMAPSGLTPRDATGPERPRQLAAVTVGNLPTSAAEIDARLSKDKEAVKSAAAKPASPAPDAARVELSATKEPVSTFSLHVSDVSFRLAQAALAREEKPDPERIRAEEFYNAFDYGDPTPATAEKISCRIEQSAHPLLQQRNLVRIAMKVPATGRGAGQPLHLTVLLDTSGSMEREDRVASVHRALEVLASLLGPNDRVTLIGFAQRPHLLVEQLPGDQAAKLAEIAASTPFTGGTNMEEALKLAGELALRHRDPAAQNRVVLVTDGAANLGDADPAQLAAKVEAIRQQGVAFDACGVGTDGLDDAVLEALTRKGAGRYYVLDKPEDADAGFARQLAGAFRPAAENVKVQVRFNPARVGRYRLLGFEQHRLREEDFRNDQVAAAELAAEEAAVAVYQVEVLPQGEGELGEVFVRFRDAATGEMVERSWTMLHDPQAPAFSRASPTMQLAGTAALLAEKLGGGPTADLVDLAELAPVVNGLRGHFANDKRVQELVAMFDQLRRMNGK